MAVNITILMPSFSYSTISNTAYVKHSNLAVHSYIANTLPFYGNIICSKIFTCLQVKQLGIFTVLLQQLKM